MTTSFATANRWVWRGHFTWLLILAAFWAVTFAQLEQSKPDARGAQGGEVALQLLAGIGHGVATAAMMAVGWCCSRAGRALQWRCTP